jgi:hypothetical protein
MAKPEKCAHQSCVCVVPEDAEFGDYCSAHCRDAKDLTELRCECGHPGCLADSSTQAAGGK